MPRYLFETPPHSRVRSDAVVRLVALRFPECTVEHRGTEIAGYERWVCRAPSEAHVHRWADAAGITIEGLRRVEADLAQSSGPG